MGKKTRSPRSLGIRIVTVVALLFTGWHVLASFLWIAPPTPLRDVVPGNALTSYMIPMFGQSWSVFAPEPINGDYKFEVRAWTSKDGGEPELHDWVDATAVELSMIRNNLFPPRAGIQTSELASTVKGRYDALTDEQRKVVALGYFKGDDSEARMSEALGGGGQNVAVNNYLFADRMARAYATQVATALWGTPDRVQFRVSRTNVIPFAERNNPDAKRPAAQIADIGWRADLTKEGQSDQAFGDIFRAQYEGINK
ncbi:hypothetical protein M2390_001472 [Mycetocola sp. BIGb0189]|uniref:DUF5819 family protein n=1 Tax=Mycetocola sp. BIGb0189 TaxID=2940604 RepID=UPI002168D872|nr:DUF5819 family protein [Mycetocola sp. BIGb0189]MCS4276290.1 hypothetical protein [Mycetocola sp. BIGb0189]